MTAKRANAEVVRLAGLMLGTVDAIVRAMLADGVTDPPGTLRSLVRNPALVPQPVAARYGPMVAACRATFTFRGNDGLVEVAIARCIAIAGSLL